jgi:hypothetical protein
LLAALAQSKGRFGSSTHLPRGQQFRKSQVFGDIRPGEINR